MLVIDGTHVAELVDAKLFYVLLGQSNGFTN